MMRPASILFNLVVLLAFFCQCGSHSDTDGYGSEYPLDSESYDTIDSCMSYMETDPARAHRMIDSVRKADIISPQRCDYLHAMVVFVGEHKPDSALMICDRLLKADKFGDDHIIEAEICDLASNVAASLDMYIEVLEYANRGIALCHGNEHLRSDEASMMGRAGVAHKMLGQIDEAQQTYARALELLREDTSFGGLIALISLQKKQGGLYRDAGDYDQVIRICHEILDLVERFDRDPSFVDPRPATMNESNETTHGFADFYQSQVYIFLARAYRMKVEQGASANPKADRDSAAAYVEKWTHTAGSHSPNNMIPALHELYFTGSRAEFEEARQAVSDFFGSDTLVVDYVEYLKLMAEDAASRRDLPASNSYLQRAVALSDSIRQKELLRTFSEQMSIHMVQQAELAQLDAEYELSRNWMTIAILVIVLLASFAINILLLVNRRRRRALETAQLDLEKKRGEVLELEQQLEEAKAERSFESMKFLYQRIEQAMTENELYLRPDLDIKMLAKVVNSSRTNTSTCINTVTGKSFRNWLAEYRLNLFVKMLKQKPNESIEVILTRCGYHEQSTFRRQFKAAYGMTAGEYRKRLIAQGQLTVNSEQLTVNSEQEAVNSEQLTVNSEQLTVNNEQLTVSSGQLTVNGDGEAEKS